MSKVEITLMNLLDVGVGKVDEVVVGFIHGETVRVDKYFVGALRGRGRGHEGAVVTDGLVDLGGDSLDLVTLVVVVVSVVNEVHGSVAHGGGALVREEVDLGVTAAVGVVDVQLVIRLLVLDFGHHRDLNLLTAVGAQKVDEIGRLGGGVVLEDSFGCGPSLLEVGVLVAEEALSRVLARHFFLLHLELHYKNGNTTIMEQHKNGSSNSKVKHSRQQYNINIGTHI